jgi:hypothetical protein
MAVGAGSGYVSLPDRDKGIAGAAGQQDAAPPWLAVSALLAGSDEMYHLSKNWGWIPFNPPPKPRKLPLGDLFAGARGVCEVAAGRLCF